MESCTLVAVTVTLLPVAGAVRTPAGVMLPADAVHVTPEEYAPVPVTAALHVMLPPAKTPPMGHVAFTAVTVGAGVTDTVVEADFVGSCVLVAVRTTVVGDVIELGTVRTPAGLTVPVEAVQMTDEE